MDGSWNSATDYSDCKVDKTVNRLVNFQISLHSLSIVFLLPAAIVFATHETFQNRRNRLILFLILVKMCESIVIVWSRSAVSKNRHTVLRENGWGCRTLTYFERTGQILTSIAMLLIILYLFMVLVMKLEYPIGKRMNMKPWYGICAAITLTTSLTWAIIMAVNLNENCWLITEELNSYIWIIDGTDAALTSIGIVLLAIIVYNYYHALRMKSINQQEIL